MLELTRYFDPSYLDLRYACGQQVTLEPDGETLRAEFHGRLAAIMEELHRRVGDDLAVAGRAWLTTGENARKSHKEAIAAIELVRSSYENVAINRGPSRPCPIYLANHPSEGVILNWFKVRLSRNCSCVEPTIEQSSVYIQAPSSKAAFEQVRARIEADEDLISDLDWGVVDSKLHGSDVDEPQVVGATAEGLPPEDAVILQSEDDLINE